MKSKTTWRQLEKQTGINIAVLKARDLSKPVEKAKGSAIQI